MNIPGATYGTKTGTLFKKVYPEESHHMPETKARPLQYCGLGFCSPQPWVYCKRDECAMWNPKGYCGMRGN